MANPEHLAILRKGVETWNKWRKDNSDIQPDLSRSELDGASLSKANLTEADLYRTNLTRANLREANLSGATLNLATLYEANLYRADLSGADLSGATLNGADLYGATLYRATLSGATLYKADLREATLSEADLTRATLIETNLENTNISGCRIFGISAWNLKTENLIQSNLIITPQNEPEITVDNLEIAQFVYLLLNNAKLRYVIDTLTTKSVLILGRFTEERKAVLDAIREELRKRDYVPMLFDFDKPANRDLTETVKTLAGLSRFVIADLSDPNSIPHELMSFVEGMPSVPVQAIFTSTDPHPAPYPMYEHIRRYPHVLPIFRYDTPEHLLGVLEEKVIKPAEAKVIEMRPPQNPVL